MATELKKGKIYAVWFPVNSWIDGQGSMFLSLISGDLVVYLETRRNQNGKKIHKIIKGDQIGWTASDLIEPGGKIFREP